MYYTYYIAVTVALICVCSAREISSAYQKLEELERNKDCRNNCKEFKETCYSYESAKETMSQPRETCNIIDYKCRMICAKSLPI